MRLSTLVCRVVITYSLSLTAPLDVAAQRRRLQTVFCYMNDEAAVLSVSPHVALSKTALEALKSDDLVLLEAYKYAFYYPAFVAEREGLVKATIYEESLQKLAKDEKTWLAQVNAMRCYLICYCHINI